MIPIHNKESTLRTATATSSVLFSNSAPYNSIIQYSNKKGDVLAVARIAGIQGAKKCSDLVPLSHPLGITGVEVDIATVAPKRSDRIEDDRDEKETHGEEKPMLDYGKVVITATVSTVGRTGVEMEALTACTVSALTVFDMCKAVDKGMEITGGRVLMKEGGRSGTWVWTGSVEGGGSTEGEKQE
jgi:GTP 3',8-cyclase